MKTQCVITSQELHTIIALFLLEQLKEQLFLAHRHPSLADKIAKAMVEELQTEVDPELWERLKSSGYWRYVKTAMEDAGLNHWTIARVMAGKWKMED